MNFPIYKFINEITEKEIYEMDNYTLSKCPFAITVLIDKYPDIINNDGISLNTNPIVIDYLRKHPNKINWNFISSNPNAIKLLKENQDKINWKNLSMNNCAYKLLMENQDKIDWCNICYNDNPKIVTDIISTNLDKPISWNILSKNTTDKAIELLKENQDKIDWEFLALNHNDNAFELIIKNLDKIDWDYLITNPNPKIIKLFENNQNKISWYYLSMNTNNYIKSYICKHMTNKRKIKIAEDNISIDEYIYFMMFQNEENEFLYYNWLNCNCYFMYKMDFEKMKTNFQNFEEDLIKEVYHPKRICKLIEAGIDIEEIF